MNDNPAHVGHGSGGTLHSGLAAPTPLLHPRTRGLHGKLVIACDALDVVGAHKLHVDTFWNDACAAPQKAKSIVVGDSTNCGSSDAYKLLLVTCLHLTVVSAEVFTFKLHARLERSVESEKNGNDGVAEGFQVWGWRRWWCKCMDNDRSDPNLSWFK
jgi:hypothetical protein